MSAVWRISLSNLSRNLLEATELANVLQEVSSSIQVTGLSNLLTTRTSTSASGTPTKLSAKERIKRALPIHIGAGSVPWDQLAGVVTSDALQEPGSLEPGQPQMFEVNTGGAVFFVFFKLSSEQQQQLLLHQAQQLQQHKQKPGHQGQAGSQLPQQQLQHQLSDAGHPMAAGAREGIAVLKIGASRLAMQAEQFANELTRHLGIAAPDCRIVRQVGATAEEWTAAVDAASRLGSASATLAHDSTAGHGAPELLMELSHLPCFLLMEYVEGNKLHDSPEALQGPATGLLLEDVGRLFLLDMLLGNADRMPCPELGWRGNASNLLYGAQGTRHEGRPVAIDSCVARRPPALKASTEDAAVERLAQLLLAVPNVSKSLLEQLLGDLQPRAKGKPSRLSDSSSGEGNSSSNAIDGADIARIAAAAKGGTASSNRAGSTEASSAAMSQTPHSVHQPGSNSAVQHAGCRDDGSVKSARLQDGQAVFDSAAVLHFQAGLRHCLTGVLQIKGLLEMVSSKIAEWIAEFVEDVVRLNPAVLPSPGPNAPVSALRSPKPSPKPSARSSLNNLSLSFGGVSALSASADSAATAAGAGAGPGASTITENSAGAVPQSSSTVGCVADSTPPGPVTPAAITAHLTAAMQKPPRGNSPSSSGCGSSATSSVSPPPSSVATPDIAASGPIASQQHGQGNGINGGSGGPAYLRSLSSPSSKIRPLARRAVSQMGFASIKAAICSSPSHTDSSAGGSPAPAAGAASLHPTVTDSSSSHHVPLCARADLVPAPLRSVSPVGQHLSCISHGSSSSIGGTHGDVATAVAAALSPRATEQQKIALAGVFGVEGFGVGSEGGGSLSSKASSWRRVTWTATDITPSRLSPRELFAHDERSLPPASSGGSNSGAARAQVAATAPGSSPQHYHLSGLPLSPVGATGHYSVPGALIIPQVVAAPIATPFAANTQSTSSLQVLASLQLDATLASIKQEARHDGALAERLAHWKALFKERGAELSEAITSWQARHHAAAAVLSTGFLDGSHPIVDAYELGVRLQHMLRRLTALAAGAMVQAPTRVLPGLFLGNAVAADSHHLLQYLGVTHVVNAAQELQLVGAPSLFHVYRVAIRDDEEENIAYHFKQVQQLIDSVLSSGGSVLVHCHEGKSRSVALLLAYLMLSKKYTLNKALKDIRSVRPQACPNAGFMAQLMELDRQLHGKHSLTATELPRAKPEVRVCQLCGAAVGVSYASLARHVRKLHNDAAGVVTRSKGAGATVVKRHGCSSTGGAIAAVAGAAVVSAGSATTRQADTATLPDEIYS